MSEDTFTKIVIALLFTVFAVIGLASGMADKLDLDDMVMMSGSME